jgi:mRNA-degrading endonuclease RelE of RelBE toxin-antitoxin system
MKISASDQVKRWLVALPPETKSRVRLALRDLQKGKGDIRALEKDLSGWCRLRVGGRRIIFRNLPGKIILLEYADSRDVVYENFLEVLSRRKDR